METIQENTKNKTFLEKIVLLHILLFSSMSIIQGQYEHLTFQREYIPSFSTGNSGVAVAVTDANLDGLEDIIRFHDARELQIHLQTPGGNFERWKSFPREPLQQWNILGLPLNQDRILDWLSAGNESGIDYWISDSLNQYTHIQDDRYEFFAQGSNALDLDGSGTIDIFMCSDLSENITLLNSNQIPYSQDSILPSSHPDPFFRAGNYGSIWEDINGDGQADMYLSKCSIFANHPSDPRRINKLLLSQTDGSYKDVAQDWNVADSAQSWASAFADVNNDGLIDLLVLNHDAPAALYIHQGTEFKKSESFEDLGLQFNSVQVLSQDLNCDGFIDFIITGRRATVLMNQGNGEFTEHPDLLGIYQQNISSAQMGDFNQDGYMDIFAARHGLYNNPGDREDVVLLNPFTSTANHFIRVQIVDSSHYIMDGIQVKAKLYSDLGMQSRTMRVGESYGVCGSNILHFGIGSDIEVDSIVFEWPDGTKETFMSLAANRLYLYTQGLGLKTEIEADVESRCFSFGDTLTINNIDANSPHLKLFKDEVEISFSEVGGITESGRYFWIDRSETGAWVRSIPFTISENPKIQTHINVKGSQILCHNETLILTPEDTSDFLFWNTGLETLDFEVGEAGLYRAYFGACGDTVLSDSIMVSYRPEVSLRVTDDTVGFGQRAILRAVGDDVRWYENIDDVTALQRGSSIFVINRLLKDTVLFVESGEIFEVDDIALGPVIDANNSEVSNPWFNAQMEFSVMSDCIFKSITVRASVEGKRDFVLVGPQSRQASFYLKADTTYVLPLNWSLAGGNDYVLTTSSVTNFEEFNTSGPQLYQVIQDEFQFPYTDGEFVTISGTNGGLKNFFYYSNWVFEVPSDTCFSVRLPVRGVVDQSLESSVINQKEGMSLFPNPAREYIFIRTTFPEHCSVEIYSSTGKLVYHQDNYFSRDRIRTQGWSSGLYTVLVKGPTGVLQQQLIVFP